MNKSALQIKPIVKVLSVVMAVVGASMLAPLLVAWHFGETKGVISFAVCAVPLIVAGLVLTLKLPKADNEELRMKDGFFIAAVTWLAMSLFGCLPFIISGDIPNFCDAFFETASGFSTTGASILSDIEALSYGMLFWRSFTHWLGGMGVLVLTIAILPMLGIGGAKIMRAETTGPTMDKSAQTVSGSAKVLYLIYFGLTVLEIVVLKLGGMRLFDCCINAFGCVGTGGFSNLNAGIGGYNSLFVEMVISVVMLLAGINFGLYASVFSGKPEKLFKDTEMRTYLGIVGGATLVIAAILTIKAFYATFWESLRYSFFQVIAIITTTGFSTADFDLWPIPCRIILFFLMFVGGCGGSTGGGLKVVRIILFFKIIKRSIQRRLHPNALAPIKMDGKNVAPQTLSQVAWLLLLYMLTAVISTIVVCFDGVDLVTAGTAVISSLSNIGPGLNMVGPTCNFGFFSGWVKILFSLLMVAGRLELYTIALMFTPNFWNPNK